MGNILPINLIEKRALEIKNDIEEYGLKSKIQFDNKQKEAATIAKNYEEKINLEKKKYNDLILEVTPLANQNESIVKRLNQGIKDEGILDELKTALKNFDAFIFKSIKVQKEYSIQTIDLNEAVTTKTFEMERTQTKKFVEDINSKKNQFDLINYLIEKHKTSSSEVKEKINLELSELISSINDNQFENWLCRKFVLNYELK